MKPEDVRDNLSAYDSDEFPDSFVDPGGCCWDTAKEMLVNSDSFLGLCGCGIQGDFDYILGGIELVEDRRRAPEYREREAWDAWWKSQKEREADLFGNDISAQFFYKWLDKEGITEHGSSVPGWLTDMGKRFLALMREAKATEGEEVGE